MASKMTRAEALKEVARLEQYLVANNNFQASDDYKAAKEDIWRLREELGLWGAYAQHTPGPSTTIWYDSRAEALESCKSANSNPWSSFAQLVSPTGKTTVIHEDA